jgi:hypothetical protein
MNFPRDVLFMITLLGMPAMPGFGQDLDSNGNIQSAAPVPDLSGIWGRNFFFFEPPPSGPGPVVSKRRGPDGIMNIFAGVAGDYTNPTLKPQAAEVVKNSGEKELGGAVHPNAHNQCWPEPTPFNLSVQLGVQIVQKKDEILLFYLHDEQVRHVRMNVPHSVSPKPTWQGESIGRYEGDTLVIDTIGQKVGPFSMFDMYGAPFSAALRVIERYRLIDGTQARDLQQKHERDYFPAGASSPFTNEYGRGDIDPDVTKQGLQVEITVDDPVMFNMPWRGLITYRHVLGEWPEAVCVENMREIGWVRHPPQAEKPDF